MTTTDRIKYYRQLAADNRTLAQDHSGTAASLTRIAAEYDSMAADLERELAQEQKPGSGEGETKEIIHTP